MFRESLGFVPQPVRVNRRFGLKLGLLAVASPKLVFAQEAETDYIKLLTSQIEARRGIELAGFPSLPALFLIDACLGVLPDDMYQPGSNGKPLKITYLGEVIEEGQVCPSSTCDPEDNERAVFEGDAFEGTQSHIQIGLSPANPRMSLEEVAHELTHIRQPKPIFDPITKGVLVAPYWFAEIDEILGGEFRFAVREIAPQVSQRFDEVNSQPTPTWEEYDRWYFYRDLIYGLTKNIIPNEFCAVLGAKYLHGREVFLRRFSEFFSLDVSEKLYDFTHRNIYPTREYLMFPFG